MGIAYWIVAGLAAFAFFCSGLKKLATSRAKFLENKNTGWAADFTAPQIKLIGLAEVLGALGLILPHVFTVAEGLAKAAAVGLFLIIVGAVNVHRKRKEPFFPPLILGVIALVTLFI